MAGQAETRQDVARNPARHPSPALRIARGVFGSSAPGSAPPGATPDPGRRCCQQNPCRHTLPQRHCAPQCLWTARASLLLALQRTETALVAGCVIASSKSGCRLSGSANRPEVPPHSDLLMLARFPLHGRSKSGSDPSRRQYLRHGRSKSGSDPSRRQYLRHRRSKSGSDPSRRQYLRHGRSKSGSDPSRRQFLRRLRRQRAAHRYLPLSQLCASRPKSQNRGPDRFSGTGSKAAAWTDRF